MYDKDLSNNPKRHKMSENTENSRVLNSFDLVRYGKIDLNDENVQEYIEKYLGREFREELEKDPIEFLGIEENKIEFYSLFYHSFESFEEKNKKDKENSESEQRRYYADTRICYKCGLTGHIDSKCPERTKNLCILCGCTDHQRFNCPQIVCAKCGMCGHRFRDCRESFDQKRRYNLCKSCPNRHSIDDCPLVWRKYKFSTLENRLIKMACSFCCKTDHFIDDCQVRKTKNSIFTEKVDEIVYFNRRIPKKRTFNRY